MMDLYFTNTQLSASQDIKWLTGAMFVDYCDVFISCLDSHSNSTHSLQRIHWWASDVMLNLFSNEKQVSTVWVNNCFKPNYQSET